MTSLWHSQEVAEMYDELSNPSAAVDEDIIGDYISNLNHDVKVVSLGIGTGRELDWLKDIDNIKKIVGIDYSESMLEVCRKNANELEKPVELIKDDFFSLEELESTVKESNFPIIYLMLINTLGDFSKEDRKKILENVKRAVRPEDSFVVAVYKLPEKIDENIDIPIPEDFLSDYNEEKISVAVEYSLYDLLWVRALKEYGQIPNFWYDEENDDVVMYVDDEKIFFSHRFSKDEIEEEWGVSGLEIQEIKEGKFMWIVIARA